MPSLRLLLAMQSQSWLCRVHFGRLSSYEHRMRLV